MMKMHFYVFLLFGSIAHFCGCEQSDSGHDSNGGTNNAIQGSWTAVSMTIDGTDFPETEQGTVELQFFEENFSVTGGCNSCGGSFSVGRDTSIQLNGQGWTEMACDDPIATKLEAVLGGLIANVDTYSIDGEQLVLSDGSDDNRLVLERTQPPRPLSLTETRWTLDVFEETTGRGEQATLSGTPVISANPIFMTIADGKASGSGGCNGFDAPCQIEDGRIEFGQQTSTLIACDENVMKQETRFFKALGNISKYSIRGDQLQLSNADGTLVLHFTGVE